MLYRPAKPEELDQIYLMGFDTWGNGMTEQDYLNHCQQNRQFKSGHWYVLVNHQNQLTASMLIYNLPNIAHLTAIGLACIATNRDHRCQGFAANMIKQAIEQQYAEVILLFSDISPTYYERFGFIALPVTLQRHTPSICMVKVKPMVDINILLNHPAALPAYF